MEWTINTYKNKGSQIFFCLFRQLLLEPWLERTDKCLPITCLKSNKVFFGDSLSSTFANKNSSRISVGKKQMITDFLKISDSEFWSEMQISWLLDPFSYPQKIKKKSFVLLLKVRWFQNKFFCQRKKLTNFCPSST